MKKYLFITIDTEEDLWGNYNVKNPPVENIKNLYKLQEIFEKYSAVPTYLMNYPVAKNKEAVRILKKLHEQKKCEIGTHCHPWNTPPYEEDPNEYNSFLCNLPEDLIKAKLDNLHNLIAENFSALPTTFRAGRWGFGITVEKAICRLGYKIDTSITPYCDWGNYSGPVFDSVRNFPHGLHQMKAHCLKDENCFKCNKFSYCILEIPPSIGFLQDNFLLANKFRNILKNKPYEKLRLIGILERLRLLNFRFLSPELSGCGDMVKLIEAMIRNGYRFFNMFFHSTSLLPGNSPFVTNQRDLYLFLSKIDRFLAFATKHHIACVGTSKAIEIL